MDAKADGGFALLRSISSLARYCVLERRKSKIKAIEIRGYGGSLRDIDKNERSASLAVIEICIFKNDILSIWVLVSTYLGRYLGT